MGWWYGRVDDEPRYSKELKLFIQASINYITKVKFLNVVYTQVGHPPKWATSWPRCDLLIQLLYNNTINSIRRYVATSV